MIRMLSRAFDSPRARGGWAAVPLLLGLATALLPRAGAEAAQNQGNTVTCSSSGKLPLQNLRSGGGSSAGQQPDLVISRSCTVSRAGNYFYGNINVVAGGTLTFTEPQGNGTQVNFWA